MRQDTDQILFTARSLNEHEEKALESVPGSERVLSGEFNMISIMDEDFDKAAYKVRSSIKVHKDN